MTTSTAATGPNRMPDSLTQYNAFNQATWEDALIIMAHEILKYEENIRYKGSLAAPALVAEFVKVGRDVKRQNPQKNPDPRKWGKEFQVTWPGRFNLMAYPTRGKFQFIPDRTCNEIDAVLAFLTFLCGTEPMPQRFQAEWGAIIPPLTRLQLTRQQGVHVLQQMSLAFVEIEQAILSDPFNSLPLHEWVSQTHPATKYLPEETTVMSVNATSKTGNKKMLCYGGSPGSTTFMYAVNHQSADFQDWARQEIDLVRDVVDQVDRSRLEQRDGNAQVAMIVEENTHEVRGMKRMIKTTNKDHANLDKRLQTMQAIEQARLEVNRDQLEEQRSTTASVQAAETGIREEIRYNGQETTEQLRAMGTKLDDVKQDITNLGLRQQISFQGMMDQERANSRAIQQSKQEILETMGDFFQRLAAYLAERDVHVDHRFDAIENWQQQFEQLFRESKTKLEHVHETQQGIKRVQKRVVDQYAAMLTVLHAAPDIIAARLREILQIPANKIWYYFQRLIALGLVDRELRETEIAQPTKRETPMETTDPAIPKPSFLKRVTRRLWHYFLRRAPRDVGDAHQDMNKPTDGETNEPRRDGSRRS